jgi:hypothetical protein
MNIFVLDKNPEKAAQMLCDKHIVKMGLEACQLLCTVYHHQQINAPYKKTHEKHPCVLWLEKDKNNVIWLLVHANAIFEEYTRRYGKIHKSSKVLEWCYFNQTKLNLSDEQLTEFVQCMPEEYKNKNVVKAYRAYYINDKKGFAKYTNRAMPRWLK